MDEILDLERTTDGTRWPGLRNWLVWKRQSVARDLSLRYWTMIGRREEWLDGWLAECLGRTDISPTKARRAGRYHCKRYN